jgi:hypothetical protein
MRSRTASSATPRPRISPRRRAVRVGRPACSPDTGRRPMARTAGESRAGMLPWPARRNKPFSSFFRSCINSSIHECHLHAPADQNFILDGADMVPLLAEVSRPKCVGEDPAHDEREQQCEAPALEDPVLTPPPSPAATAFGGDGRDTCCSCCCLGPLLLEGGVDAEQETRSMPPH